MKNSFKYAGFIVVIAVIIGVTIFAYLRHQNFQHVKIIENENLAKYVTSLTAFAMGKRLMGITDENKILSLVASESRLITSKLKDYNIHIQIASDDITVSLCDKNKFLRYKDFYKATKNTVDHEFFDKDIPCEYTGH